MPYRDSYFLQRLLTSIAGHFCVKIRLFFVVLVMFAVFMVTKAEVVFAAIGIAEYDYHNQDYSHKYLDCTDSVKLCLN